MRSEQIQPTLAVDPGSGQDAQDRQQQLERLYQNNYSAILEIIAADRRLTFQDHSDILTDFTRYRADYDGPTENDAAFLEWARDVLRLPIAFYGMKREYDRSVLAGLWAVLKKCSDLAGRKDLKQTARELVYDVWVWAFLHLDALLTPGTAKLSTRLYQRAYWTARAWRTEKLRERKRFEDGLEPDNIGSRNSFDFCDRTLTVEPEYSSPEEKAYERSETL